MSSSQLFRIDMSLVPFLGEGVQPLPPYRASGSPRCTPPAYPFLKPANVPSGGAEPYTHDQQMIPTTTMIQTIFSFSLARKMDSDDGHNQLIDNQQVLPCNAAHITFGNAKKDDLGAIIKKGREIPFFNGQYKGCPSSEDMNFINKYLSKTYSVRPYPVDADSVFGIPNPF